MYVGLGNCDIFDLHNQPNSVNIDISLSSPGQMLTTSDNFPFRGSCD